MFKQVLVIHKGTNTSEFVNPAEFQKLVAHLEKSARKVRIGLLTMYYTRKITYQCTNYS